MNEEAFQHARAEHAYRQTFLETIDLEDKGQYIREVQYQRGPLLRKILKKVPYIMEAVPPMGSRVGIKGLRAKIIVNERAFNHPCIISYPDFLSSLIDHEGRHAQEFYETPQEVCKVMMTLPFFPLAKRISSPFLKRKVTEFWQTVSAQELRAYYQQGCNAQARGVSKPMSDFINKRYAYFSGEVAYFNDRLR